MWVIILVNAIHGEDVVIVSEIPGSTGDAIDPLYEVTENIM